MVGRVADFTGIKNSLHQLEGREGTLNHCRIELCASIRASLRDCLATGSSAVKFYRISLRDADGCLTGDCTAEVGRIQIEVGDLRAP